MNVLVFLSSSLYFLILLMFIGSQLNKSRWLDRKEIILFTDSFRRESLSRWCTLKLDIGQGASPYWLEAYSGHLPPHVMRPEAVPAFSYHLLGLSCIIWMFTFSYLFYDPCPIHYEMSIKTNKTNANKQKQKTAKNLIHPR